MKRTNTIAVKTKKPAAPKKAPTAKSPATKEQIKLQEFISASLDGDKAQDIVTIDLKGKTAIADFMLIATGTSSRHVIGMAQKLRDKLSIERSIKARVEGLESGDWAIVDAGDVIVHLFREEVRAFYNLEKLWGADFSTVNYTRYQSV
ncbi:MAG: ribosome silencing factor [Proteobacteria bacterium]|nr:ribosome silencing factor [Pseudomonadota bacterium]